ncbi:MAG: MarC family protein [Pseudomonadota bacterium]
MDFSSVDAELAVTLLLLLLIGLGPKIALVPFLEKTKKMTPAHQREIGQRMVKTAVVTALILFASGALLMRLLHITTGAVAVGGGIILALIAVKMASGPAEDPHEDLEIRIDPKKIAIYPLAIPYLLNPVGVTILIIASGSVEDAKGAALVVALILAVGAFDWVVFSNIDKLSKRLNPASLVISEVVFGILLTAVAVQLVVTGLGSLGIIDAQSGHP